MSLPQIPPDVRMEHTIILKEITTTQERHRVALRASDGREVIYISETYDTFERALTKALELLSLPAAAPTPEPPEVIT